MIAVFWSLVYYVCVYMLPFFFLFSSLLHCCRVDTLYTSILEAAETYIIFFVAIFAFLLLLYFSVVVFFFHSHLVKYVQPICLLARTTIINCDWSAFSSCWLCHCHRHTDCCLPSSIGATDRWGHCIYIHFPLTQLTSVATSFSLSLIYYKMDAHLIFQIAIILHIW